MKTKLKLIFFLIAFVFSFTANAQDCDYKDKFASQPASSTDWGTKEEVVDGWTYYCYKKGNNNALMRLNNAAGSYQGYVKSPVFSGGCNAISFEHYYEAMVNTSYACLIIEIEQDGNVVWSQNISSVQGLTYNTFSVEKLGISGNFQIIFRANGISSECGLPNYTSGNTEPIRIRNICITSNNEPVEQPAPLVPNVVVSGLTNPAGGFWNNANVTLSSTEQNVNIYYTTNNSEPTGASTLYTVPFDLTETTRVKAIAVANELSSVVLDTLISVTAFPESMVEATITMNSVSRTMTLVEKGSGTPVNVGTPNASYVYTFFAETGDYIMTGYNSTGVATGTMEISIFNDGEMLDGGGQYGKIFRITTITAAATNAGWALGTDYDMECQAASREGDARVITTADDVVTAGRRTFMMQVGDSYRLVFTMSASRVSEGYLATFNHASVVTATSATATTAIPLNLTYTITIPKDANLYVGGKWGGIVQSSGGTHYVPFIDQYPVGEPVVQGDKKTYTYSFGQNCVYNFKVSQSGKLTYGGKFQVTTTTPPLEITAEMLNREIPTYINHNTADNNGANEADIFMNINAEGHLKLKNGQTHHLLNLRRWQLTDNSTNNYFIEPDFHYTVTGLDGKPSNSVVEIDGKGVITTKGSGTAIVQVTYDAIYLEQYTSAGVASSFYYGALWSAIWPENTGTFVVTVDEQSDFDLKPNMGIRSGYTANTFVDSEHDVFYYLSNEPGYEYTFTPEGISSVSIANPTLETNISKYSGFKNVTANEDGSYTVLLTFGRNIVKLTSASGASVYQVLNAKPVSYEIVNVSNPGLPIQAGDRAKVQFNGFFHPANKLAGIYNMSAYVTYNGIPNGTSLILSPNQYQFCGTPSAQAVDVTIPKDWDVATPFMLQDGAIQINGFGSQIGRHRTISPLTGTNPNFTAVVRVDYFGSIPDVAITVNPTKYFKVNFADVPENAVITVFDKDKKAVLPVSEGSYEYDLSYGSYSYAVSCSGYQTTRNTIVITDESPEQQDISASMAPLSATDWDGVTKAEPAKVTAEESNTAGGQFEGMEGFYKITKGAELAWFADETNAGRSSHSAVMTNNICLSNFDWTRIGNSSTANQYKGTFDGGGFTVSGLYIDATTTYQGLFGYINAATVRNLTVEGSVKSTQNYAGGIIAYSIGNSVIENCRNKATVSGVQYAGGVLGASVASGAIQITACSNSAAITGTLYVGGIAGQVPNSTAGMTVMSEVSNTGNITGTTVVGGIAGASGAAAITNAYNQGNISGTTANIGGISGNAIAAAIITNAYNTGNITTTSATYKGGAIKETSTTGTLINTYAYAGNYDLTNVTVKTNNEFASGEVAWLLGAAFGQTIGTDDLPLLNKATVYQVIYTNNLDDETETFYTNGALPEITKDQFIGIWKTEENGETISSVSSDSHLFLMFVTPATSVTLNESSITVEEKETYQLTATVLPADATNQNVAWESSNNEVATVVNGLVTAIAAGEATITVTTEDGSFTATCTVTVIVSATSVTLNESSITLDEKETYQLTATILPANATDKNVTWKSSNNEVATVVNGLVTAVAAGSATITVTTVDGGFTASCEVTVREITGINDVHGVTFGVYPNPFVDYIIINTTGNGTATIYTVSGTAILNANLQNGSNRIETSALPQGVYMLKVGKSAVKIVK